jgi:hypothetical protein
MSRRSSSQPPITAKGGKPAMQVKKLARKVVPLLSVCKAG